MPGCEWMRSSDEPLGSRQPPDACTSYPKRPLRSSFKQLRKRNVRKPRWAAGFRGTLRYAPISCHISRELCRKDDLETWLYQQVEITRGYLPWRHLDDKDEVARLKEKCRAEENHKDLFAGCPREYVDIMFYLDTVRYYDTPDYQKLMDLLKQAIMAHSLQEYPYDWEKPEWQKLSTIP